MSAAEAATDGAFEASFVVRNTGGRDGVEVVQLYAHDPVASVVRPVQRLVGYVRVPLAAGASARVSATVPADVLSFTGRDGRRIVEPGAIELRFGASSADVRLVAPVSLVGAVRVVDHTRELHAPLVVGEA
ncbi:Periplasmic beta-glucosidase precursor [compost metagenome]